MNQSSLQENSFGYHKELHLNYYLNEVKTLYREDVLYISACRPRETIVDLGFANNGCNEFRFHRHGHAMDDSGSRCSLHWKQATAVSRLFGHVAGSL